jgi:hypothetical protein
MRLPRLGFLSLSMRLLLAAIVLLILGVATGMRWLVWSAGYVTIAAGLIDMFGRD